MAQETVDSSDNLSGQEKEFISDLNNIAGEARRQAYSQTNLKSWRKFYLNFNGLQIGQALLDQFKLDLLPTDPLQTGMQTEEIPTERRCK